MASRPSPFTFMDLCTLSVTSFRALSAAPLTAVENSSYSQRTSESFLPSSMHLDRSPPVFLADAIPVDVHDPIMLPVSSWHAVIDEPTVVDAIPGPPGA